GMEVSCISTGQVFAALGLMCTESVPMRRRRVIEVLQGLIDLAAEFGKMVNLGRVRGSINGEPRQAVEDRFVSVARELCDYAADKDVTLVLEPVNRYEIDFVNKVEEGVALVREVRRANFRLMPDVFHMNIEDVSIGGELARHAAHVAYIHLADSNRLAPGRGHIDFDDIFDHLAIVEYDGWVSVEILPKPDPDTAARQAAEFLRPRVDLYNSRLMALRGEPCP
ncbi:MAG: sugar phosphate isomerase/epimerase, partial [Pirellulaceae bacterium]|nr:sugar phosphate isomerase/epimerase [Pirellulaceae bacterium]